MYIKVVETRDISSYVFEHSLHKYVFRLLNGLLDRDNKLRGICLTTTCIIIWSTSYVISVTTPQQSPTYSLHNHVFT